MSTTSSEICKRLAAALQKSFAGYGNAERDDYVEDYTEDYEESKSVSIEASIEDYKEAVEELILCLCEQHIIFDYSQHLSLTNINWEFRVRSKTTDVIRVEETLENIYEAFKNFCKRMGEIGHDDKRNFYSKLVSAINGAEVGIKISMVLAATGEIDEPDDRTYILKVKIAPVRSLGTRPIVKEPVQKMRRLEIVERQVERPQKVRRLEIKERLPKLSKSENILEFAFQNTRQWGPGQNKFDMVEEKNEKGSESENSEEENNGASLQRSECADI